MQGGARSSNEDRFLRALEIENRYFDDLYQHNIVAKERAREGMASYR